MTTNEVYGQQQTAMTAAMGCAGLDTAARVFAA
jgi:hypothetical protein